MIKENINLIIIGISMGISYVTLVLVTFIFIQKLLK